MWFKLLLVVLTALAAFYIQVKGVRSDYMYQPPFIPLRLALFCAGFLFTSTLIWLVMSEWVWYQLLISVAGGYSWAYAVPGQLKYVQMRSRRSPKRSGS
jgi:hypothetical protein